MTRFMLLIQQERTGAVGPEYWGANAMKRLATNGFLLAGLLLALPATAQTLAGRISHYDPAKTRDLKSVHGGAGTMKYMGLMDTKTLSTDFIFLHRGFLNPKGGIGQHFHNQCEEMFVILDGEAEFTINGRTSRLSGPAGAPNRMGSSHAIYNHTDKPVEWMNINVGTSKTYDNFDMGDTREGAALDPIPQFITMKLEKSLLKPAAGQTGVSRRRALGPSVFYTPWSYLDHVLVAPGAATTATTLPDMSEVYYVISGEGSVTVNGETVAIKKGDAVPDGDAPVHATGEIHVVSGDQRGEAGGADQGDQDPEDVRRRVRVEVAGGLVGEQQARAVGDRARDGDALLLAAGEFRRPVS
ncbi:MAG: cupin domain-containing protein [Acetobacteraceae bacterium]|nr:MAG: cupin domain-containing protein [Acetobacteraceae bacterium]